MLLAGLTKCSFVDYPGLTACVLFVPGCNYDCFYCHNRGLIDGTHEVLLPGYVEDFLKRRASMLDGVVVTGGEPTLQPGLSVFLEKMKTLGYKTKLDTNGSNPEAVKELLDKHLCDYVAVDYKAPALRYKEICGPRADPNKVLSTIRILLASSVPFEVRTTVIPQLTGEDLVAMAKELPPLPRYVLNRYRKPEKYLPEDEERVNRTPYTQAEVDALAELVKPYQPNAAV